MKANDARAINRLLNPSENRPGHRSVTSEEQSLIVKEKLKDAAFRGFAIGTHELRGIFAGIVANNKRQYNTPRGVLSFEVI